MFFSVILKHHTQIQNAKRYLRHLENHHADFLFRKNNRGTLKVPWNYLKEIKNLVQDQTGSVINGYQWSFGTTILVTLLATLLKEAG